MKAERCKVGDWGQNGTDRSQNQKDIWRAFQRAINRGLLPMEASDQRKEKRRDTEQKSEVSGSEVSGFIVSMNEGSGKINGSPSHKTSHRTFKQQMQNFMCSMFFKDPRQDNYQSIIKYYQNYFKHWYLETINFMNSYFYL